MISNVDLDYHMLVIKLNTDYGNTTFKVTVKSPNAVVPTNPSAPESIIESYVFHHTRLIKIYKFNNFGGVNLVPDPIVGAQIDCEQPNPVEMMNTDYIVKFKLPHDLLADGQLKIESFEYQEVIPFCSNTANSLLTGNLNCAISTSYAHLDSFDFLDKNKLVEMKGLLQNPVYDAAVTTR